MNPSQRTALKNALLILPFVLGLWFVLLEPFLVPIFGLLVEGFLALFYGALYPAVIAAGNDWHVLTRVAAEEQVPGKISTLILTVPLVSSSMMALPFTLTVLGALPRRRWWNLLFGTAVICLLIGLVLLLRTLDTLYLNFDTGTTLTVFDRQQQPESLVMATPFWFAPIRAGLGLMNYLLVLVAPVWLGWVFTARDNLLWHRKD